MADILVSGGAYISTPSACIADLTPPTFSGINTLQVQSRGQIRATWSAGTDATAPIRYEVYIQANTATGLFNVANIIAITPNLQYDTFTMPDGSFLQNGTTYHVGVRAIDAVNNRDANTVSLNVVSTGVSVSADIYKTEGAFALNSSNELQGTLWCLKNSVLATNSNAVLGTASYTVYDKSGATTGISETGITPDSNGQYIITPVASTLNKTLDHYMIKVDINVDTQIRSGYVSLIQEAPLYDLDGVFSLNESNELEATFWVKANEIIKTTGLGTASYEIYDKTGTLVSGMSESGISADSNGLFKITPVASTLQEELAHYSVKIIINVDSVNRSEFLGIQGKIPVYEAKAVFSINALNQLQATFWAIYDGKVKTGSGLGQANYTVYDSSGTAVAGLTQSGISANVNGLFQINPVNAVLLTDLTHYTVKVGIVVNGVERVSYKSFTLLGN